MTDGVGHCAGNSVEVWNPHKNPGVVNNVVIPMMLVRGVSVCYWMPHAQLFWTVDKCVKKYAALDQKKS